jgi:hypothetical protein
MRLLRATPRRAAVAGLLITLMVLIGAPVASADHTQFSIFQDDQYLLYSKPKVLTRTLATLKELGVQELRITVKWAAIAPSPLSRTKPGGYFTAYNPSTYPTANWAPYDRIVERAAKYGLKVLFTITGPGPLWATANRPPSAAAATHWYLNASEFEQFVIAAGLRYDGHYFNIPAVTNWSIWNEPDQPGWLAPQTLKVQGQSVAQAPRLYRSYVDGAWSALNLTGHTPATNTILIGELAPESSASNGVYLPTAPMPFMRDLYCVGSNYRPLTGTAATELACPATSAARASFAADNPALFDATGFAEHPYYFTKTPSYNSPNRNWVPIDDIGRLENGLDRALGAWSVHRKLPIYFTEYGYATKPPNPFQVVTPAEQAAYLNQADYMAWKNSRVLSVAQFELYDSPPNPLYKKGTHGYWDTFQTGLLFQNGTPKPAFAAYRMPIWIPSAHFHAGSSVEVWGQLRPADGGAGATAQVRWRGATGAFRTLGTVSTQGTEGYFTTHVKPPGTGVIQIRWLDRHTVITSRLATVSQS